MKITYIPLIICFILLLGCNNKHTVTKPQIPADTLVSETSDNYNKINEKNINLFTSIVWNKIESLSKHFALFVNKKYNQLSIRKQRRAHLIAIMDNQIKKCRLLFCNDLP